MKLSPADQARVLEALDGLVAAANSARQAPNTEACKRALASAWAANTRAVLAINEAVENARVSAMNKLEAA